MRSAFVSRTKSSNAAARPNSLRATYF